MRAAASGGPISAIVERYVVVLIEVGVAEDAPLRKDAAAHHSKNCALMSQMGQKLTSTAAPARSALAREADRSNSGSY